MSNDKEVQRDLFGNAILSESDNVYLNKGKQTKEKRDLSDTAKTEYVLEIVCIDANEQELMYNELLKKGFECRVLTL